MLKQSVSRKYQRKEEIDIFSKIFERHGLNNYRSRFIADCVCNVVMLGGFIVTIYNHGQNIVDKFSKLSKIRDLPSMPYFSGIFLKFPNFLRS